VEPGRETFRCSGRSGWRRGTGCIASDCAILGTEAKTEQLASRFTGSSATVSGATGAAPSFASIKINHRPDGRHAAAISSRTTRNTRGERRGEPRRPHADNARELRREGTNADPEINGRAAPRQQPELPATLLLSQGAPERLGGTSSGAPGGQKKTAWCVQDNEISWWIGGESAPDNAT